MTDKIVEDVPQAPKQVEVAKVKAKGTLKTYVSKDDYDAQMAQFGVICHDLLRRIEILEKSCATTTQLDDVRKELGKAGVSTPNSHDEVSRLSKLLHHARKI